jgi:hypothetical protein
MKLLKFEYFCLYMYRNNCHNEIVCIQISVSSVESVALSDPEVYFRVEPARHLLGNSTGVPKMDSRC